MLHCNENSMDAGSTASTSRPLTKDSKLMILFNFTENSPGIGLISHVKKPVLPEIEEDAVAMIQVYIESKRQLAIRWKPKSLNDTSSWHLTQYIPPLSASHCVFRSGIAVHISDEKNYLASKRSDLIKKMIDEGDKRVSGRPKAQTQLNFTENQQEASSLATLTNVTSAESPLISTKRPYEDLEQELAESDAKRLSLEIENRELKDKMLAILDENNELKKDPVRLLTETVLGASVVMQRFIDGSTTYFTNGPLPGTPQSSASTPTTTSERTPVKLYGTVCVNADALKKAIITGRTKTQNPSRRLNATVTVLLSGWYTTGELSLMSLAGKACPSIPGSVAKRKFPEDIMEAIIKFLIPKWENWHQVVLTPEQIKSAVGDRLLACHTSERKRKLKEAAASDGENANEETSALEKNPAEEDPSD